MSHLNVGAIVILIASLAFQRKSLVACAFSQYYPPDGLMALLRAGIAANRWSPFSASGLDMHAGPPRRSEKGRTAIHVGR